MPTFDELKFEGARHHSLRDVFLAEVVVVA